MSRSWTREALHRRFLPLTLAWSLAWLLGLSSLAGLAVHLHGEKTRHKLEGEMRLFAMVLYGVAYFDEQGVFHAEWLIREPLMVDPPFDLWVIAPGPTVHLRPSSPRFGEPDFAALREPVLAAAEDVWRRVTLANGDDGVVFATPAFSDADDENPVAMIAVVASRAESLASVRRFAESLLLGVALLGLAGLGIGAALSKWSLGPAMDSLDQRERFLAGAAHELRTPLAVLRSIVDGARRGVEPPEKALQRIAPLLEDAGHLVSDLLLYARLDSGDETLNREPLRLDLLVETCLPDSAEPPRILLELAPEEVVADFRLAGVAVRNLLANALQHGGPHGSIRVASVPGGLAVADDGPGYSPEVLAASRRDDLRFLPSTGGVGAGLALVKLIAELHGGGLTLGNGPSGGARAELILREHGSSSGKTP